MNNILCASAERFHHNNPEVWKLFKKFAFEAIRSGRKRFSSKMIYERIRWYTTVETKGETYKLSNNYHAFYSRLFMKTYPEFEGFFNTKPSVFDRLYRKDESTDVILIKMG